MRKREPRPFIKSKPLLFLLVLLPIITIVFITILAVQAAHVRQLQEQTAQLERDLSELRVQNLFYKRAYEATLNDILSLSSIYGGQQRYNARAEELRKQELSIVFARYNITTWPSFEPRNPALWDEYLERGVIRVDCLPPPLAVEGVTNETLVVVRASSPGPAELHAYADGNFITTLRVGQNTTHSFALILADGGHELSLVTKQSGVRIEELYLDAEPLNATVIDAGEDWAVFDCKDAAAGNVFSAPGAARVLFEKR